MLIINHNNTKHLHFIESLQFARHCAGLFILSAPKSCEIGYNIGHVLQKGKQRFRDMQWLTCNLTVGRFRICSQVRLLLRPAGLPRIPESWEGTSPRQGLSSRPTASRGSQGSPRSLPPWGAPPPGSRIQLCERMQKGRRKTLPQGTGPESLSGLNILAPFDSSPLA